MHSESSTLRLRPEANIICTVTAMHASAECDSCKVFHPNETIKQIWQMPSSQQTLIMIKAHEHCSMSRDQSAKPGLCSSALTVLCVMAAEGIKHKYLNHPSGTLWLPDMHYQPAASAATFCRTRSNSFLVTGAERPCTLTNLRKRSCQGSSHMGAWPGQFSTSMLP